MLTLKWLEHGYKFILLLSLSQTLVPHRHDKHLTMNKQCLTVRPPRCCSIKVTYRGRVHVHYIPSYTVPKVITTRSDYDVSITTRLFFLWKDTHLPMTALAGDLLVVTTSSCEMQRRTVKSLWVWLLMCTSGRAWYVGRRLTKHDLLVGLAQQARFTQSRSTSPDLVISQT